MLVEKNTVELFYYPLELEDYEVLDQYQVDGDGVVMLERIEYGECGYERASDWTRLVNKFDKFNYQSFIENRFKSLKGVYKVTTDGNDMSIIFDKPIKYAFGRVGDKIVVEEITEIYGTITWNWYNSGSAEQHDKFMNGIEVQLIINKVN